MGSHSAQFSVGDVTQLFAGSKGDADDDDFFAQLGSDNTPASNANPAEAHVQYQHDQQLQGHYSVHSNGLQQPHYQSMPVSYDPYAPQAYEHYSAISQPSHVQQQQYQPQQYMPQEYQPQYQVQQYQPQQGHYDQNYSYDAPPSTYQPDPNYQHRNSQDAVSQPPQTLYHPASATYAPPQAFSKVASPPPPPPARPKSSAHKTPQRQIPQAAFPNESYNDNYAAASNDPMLIGQPHQPPDNIASHGNFNSVPSHEAASVHPDQPDQLYQPYQPELTASLQSGQDTDLYIPAQAAETKSLSRNDSAEQYGPSTYPQSTDEPFKSQAPNATSLEDPYAPHSDFFDQISQARKQSEQQEDEYEQSSSEAREVFDQESVADHLHQQMEPARESLRVPSLHLHTPSDAGNQINYSQVQDQSPFNTSHKAPQNSIPMYDAAVDHPAQAPPRDSYDYNAFSGSSGDEQSQHGYHLNNSTYDPASAPLPPQPPTLHQPSSNWDAAQPSNVPLPPSRAPTSAPQHKQHPYTSFMSPSQNDPLSHNTSEPYGSTSQSMASINAYTAPVPETRPPYPIATFGFGGHLVTYFPPPSSLTPFAHTVDNPTSSQILHIRHISDYASYSPAADPLGSDLSSTPEPACFESTGKNKKKDREQILTWISKHGGVEDSPSLPKPRSILLKVVSTLIRALDPVSKKGQSLTRKEFVSSVSHALINERDAGPVTPVLPTAAELQRQDNSTDSSPIIRTLQVRQSSIQNLHSALSQGDREGALSHALQEGLFAHALLIASSLDGKAWGDVVGRFIDAELHTSDANDLPTSNAYRDLRSFYWLLAGQPHNVKYDSLQQASEDDASWTQTLSVLWSNVTKNGVADAQAMASLAASFRRNQSSDTSQIAYLLSSLIMYLSKTNSDSAWPPSSTIKQQCKGAVDAMTISILPSLWTLLSPAHVQTQDIVLVQVLEYLDSLMQGSSLAGSANKRVVSQRSFNLPEQGIECVITSDSPQVAYYYYLYAIRLADWGRLNDAQKVCEFIEKAVQQWIENSQMQQPLPSSAPGSGKSTPFQAPQQLSAVSSLPFIPSALIYQSNQLSHRIASQLSSPGAIRKGGQNVASSWGMFSGKMPMQRPTLDNIWTSLEGRITKFVAGDDEEVSKGRETDSKATSNYEAAGQNPFQAGRGIRETVSMSNMARSPSAASYHAGNEAVAPSTSPSAAGPFANFSSITLSSKSPSPTPTNDDSIQPPSAPPHPARQSPQASHSNTHSHQRSVSLGYNPLESFTSFSEDPYRSASAAATRYNRTQQYSWNDYSDENVPNEASLPNNPAYDTTSEPPLNQIDRKSSYGDSYYGDDPYGVAGRQSEKPGYAGVSAAQLPTREHDAGQVDSDDLGQPQQTQGWWSAAYDTDDQNGHTDYFGRGRSGTIRPAPSAQYGYHAQQSSNESGENMVAEDTSGLISPMGNFSGHTQMDPSRYLPPSTQSRQQPPNNEYDAYEDDLGLGNRSKVPSPNKDQQNEEKAEQEKREEEKAKQEVKSTTSSSWLSKWFKRDNSSPGPTKAKLGEETSFVYDPVEKRWVNRKAGATDTPSSSPPPPPSRAQTASPTASGRSSGRVPSYTPPPMSSSQNRLSATFAEGGGNGNRLAGATSSSNLRGSSRLASEPPMTVEPGNSPTDTTTQLPDTDVGDMAAPPPPRSRPPSAAPPSRPGSTLQSTQAPPEQLSSSDSRPPSAIDQLSRPPLPHSSSRRGGGKVKARYVDVMSNPSR